MKTLADRIWDVRSWLAPLVANVPGSSSYIVELDAIAHDVRDCERGRISSDAPTVKVPLPRARRQR